MDSNVEFSLSIADLQCAHIERQEEWCPDQKPDLSFRGNELGGECGETLNVIKKLERERHGWRGSRDTLEHLAEELADVIHCTVLVAITAGIDLQSAVIDKFNSTTLKNGLATLLACSPPPAVEPVAVHPDDEAVDRFAAAMKEKLAKKRAEGRDGWDQDNKAIGVVLSRLLREHVEKGDPLDVGNLAMMIHQRGETIR